MTWLQFTVIALAAFRIWQLLANDDLFDRPRRYVTERAPAWVADFIACPYCLGFWVAAGWIGAWAVWPHATWWAALPFAVNTVAVAVNELLSSGRPG